MLVVPVTGKISWKNPPFVTIGLILVNCLVFFLFQLNDTAGFYKAKNYYLSSGLARLEVSRYLKYKNHKDSEFSPKNKKPGKKNIGRGVKEMEADSKFIEKLKSDKIITKNDPEYGRWRALRTRYEKMLSHVVFLKYGFIPAHKTALTAFTCMFLHGGFGHLLGNMIFLWLIGCMLEIGCGRLFCLSAYVVSGFAAVTFFGFIYNHSTVPLVGASGAIAGFMGAFTIVYGRSMIKVFYSLGFYFNYVKFRGIVLFPIWLGNEFFQLYFGSHSNVAYVAHIGGLIIGALLGYLDLKFFGLKNKALFKDDPEDEISPMIEKALRYIGELEMEKARQLLEQVLEKAPDNHVALLHLFNIDKIDPENRKFHSSAINLLNYYSRTRETHADAYNIYKEYTGLARHPKLPPNLYLKLSSAFSNIGHIKISEQILFMLIKKKPDLPGIPQALLKLADGYKKYETVDKRQKCLKFICKKYPGSVEARIAKTRHQQV